MLRTRQVYMPLREDAFRALIALAQANRRHPKHEAARIIEFYLRKRGLIADAIRDVSAQEGEYGKPVA